MLAAGNVGISLLVVMVIFPGASQQTSDTGHGFPYCVTSKGQTFDQLYEEYEALESCQALCLEKNTTRYGLMKGAGYTTDKVGCDCDDFMYLSDNRGYCDFVCGKQNYSCGGSSQETPPFWISVYPVCDPYDMYGFNCSHPCPDHCDHGCKITSGSCIYGCKAGWEQVECDERCPRYCKNDTCNVRICSEGCEDGRFGHDCEQKCPENCLEATCEQRTGQCDKGTCKTGWYGAVCALPCPANCNGSSCNASGFCEGGCLTGFYGHVCSTPCPEHCGNASGVNSCHKEHGACTAGCEPSWFGRYCSEPCPGACNASRCDAESGACTRGCSGPHFGPMCTNPCPRHCAAGGFCNVTTGQCLDGCEPGWKGNRCQVEDISGASIPGWASGTMVALFFCGAIASAVVLYIVVIRQRMNTSPRSQFRHYRLPENDDNIPATRVEDQVVQQEIEGEELEEGGEEERAALQHVV